MLAFAWKSVVEFVRCIGEPLTQVSNEVGTQMKEAAQTLTSLMGLNVYWESGQTEAEG
ncbi:hypothetical protein [Paraburkholderia megapolitana]|uniref:hypothetical protein n=1 Tax=Paraburkholderia megapolitana TaxID=420953 RepID=UPI001478788E|nr:hypothetical protein [Paraburkholderia megapolitana]